MVGIPQGGVYPGYYGRVYLRVCIPVPWWVYTSLYTPWWVCLPIHSWVCTPPYHPGYTPPVHPLVYGLWTRWSGCAERRPWAQSRD